MQARYLLIAGAIMLAELDRRLQYGAGMRAQRLVEAAFLLAAFFTGDLRFAWVTLGLTGLQAISPRLVPVALAVAAVVRPSDRHAVGDLYFDLAGTRWACAISVVVQLVGLWLAGAGHRSAGFVILSMPAASFLLSPTVGFCCGCAVYVLLRNVLARFSLVERCADGACDVSVER